MWPRYAPQATCPLRALVLFIILSNVPALENGIGPNSWPLVSIGLAGVYAIAAATIASWSRPGR